MATPPSLPAIPRWATLRNSLRFAYNPIAALDQYVAEYGPTFEFYLGGMVKGILTTDPGLAQHVLQKEHRKWRKSPIQTERMGYFLGNGLLTSDGDYWLRQRRLIQPGFHRKRLAGLTGIMNQEIGDFLEQRFQPALAGGQPVDMSPLMMELAFRVVAKSLFTTSLQEEDLAMRLYPPAWITDRLCVEDDQYGDLPLPKGSRVVAYIYGIHRRPSLWDDPEAFRPERFSRERKKEYHPFAFMPFGGGPRLCIGNNFALMEMQLVLVKILRRYELEAMPGFEPELQPLITLRPRNGVMVRVSS